MIALTIILLVGFITVSSCYVVKPRSTQQKWQKASNGRFYKINEKPLAWSDANHLCTLHSAKLLTIEDVNAQEIAKQLVQGHQTDSFWTGLVEDLFKQWTWEGIGKPKYLNWAKGQPFGDRLNGCAKMNYNGRWQVSDCEVSRKSICQKENGDDDADIEDAKATSNISKYSIVNDEEDDDGDDDTNDDNVTDKSGSEFATDRFKPKVGPAIARMSTETQDKTALVPADPSGNIIATNDSTSNTTTPLYAKEMNASYSKEKSKASLTPLKQIVKQTSHNNGVSNGETPLKDSKNANKQIHNSSKNAQLENIASAGVNDRNVSVQLGKTANSTTFGDLSDERKNNTMSLKQEEPALQNTLINMNNTNTSSDMVAPQLQQAHLKEIDISSMITTQADTTAAKKELSLLRDSLNGFRIESKVKGGKSNNKINETTKKRKTVARVIKKAAAKPKLVPPQAIQTFGGSGKRHHCIFPFRYDGELVSQCIGHKKQWCAVTHNYDRDALWGYCKSSIPISTASNNNTKEKVQNKTTGNHGNADSSKQSHRSSELDQALGSVLEKEGVSEADQSSILTYVISDEEKSPMSVVHDEDEGGDSEAKKDKATKDDITDVFSMVYGSNEKTPKESEEQKNMEGTTDTTETSNKQDQGIHKNDPTKQSAQSRVSVPPVKIEKTPKITDKTPKRIEEAPKRSKNHVRTHGGNGDGNQCSFPFVYNGVSYFNCITEIRNKPWCATVSNYDKLPVWGYCIKDNNMNSETTDNLPEPDGKQNPQSNNKQQNSGQSGKGGNSGNSVSLQDYASQLANKQKSKQTQEQETKPTAENEQSKDTADMLHEAGEEQISVHSGLKTYGGNALGARCTFPFVYDGNSHMKCIPRDDGTSWCATTHNYDSNAKWGYCCDEEHCGSLF